jgi:lysophospholipase L1-like esterase
MNRSLTLFSVLLLAPLSPLYAADTVIIPVDSPAFVFSPGNWTGDAGRAGTVFRQTWNPGAYLRVTWETRNPKPAAKLLLDISTYPPKFRPPQIAYNIDGVWKSQIPCTSEVEIKDIAGAGKHELSVYLHQSQQTQRWGSEGKSGLNVLRVTGLQVDAMSKPIPAATESKWALIVGDSITEGCGATELAAYSHLLGQALQTQGYEYCINACGWSGWIHKGDNPPGDVPGYYVITNSRNGGGGQYDEAASRWNKIDGNRHSLLDSRGHISAYGKAGQEPSLIVINYGTNDSLHKSNPSDTFASIVESLAALRKTAPDAQIIVVIPFGQYYAKELKAAVEIHKQAHPADAKIAIIDLGPAVARTLAAKNGLMGGLHPNDRGHALFAAKIIPQVLAVLNSAAKKVSCSYRYARH